MLHEPSDIKFLAMNCVMTKVDTVLRSNGTAIGAEMKLCASLEAFQASYAELDVVGFHATSSRAASQIEAHGFLPNKILNEGEHQALLRTALALGIDITSYRDWLYMRSVTFSRQVQAALAHAKSGHSAGQGLHNVLSIANQIAAKGNPEQIEQAHNTIAKIEQLRNTPAVIYAVNLAGLGSRLVPPDEKSPHYQYCWHPEHPLPTISDIDQTRLIARLDVAHSP